ncbi:MAG: CoA-transferase [Peptococcaceae bacterium]|jgi:acyl CoA:acetate/3-ketoacid CoA transferase beta subunit|nr:hypothetical protein [Peptococcaceae bacterium]MDH7526479.1 CoA-transferase [Peptococcaceae bacterium]
MGAIRYSTNELMAVTASRLLKDGQNIVVGLGLPQVATLLAQNTHAPNINIIYEIGVINPEAVDPGVGIADPRLWHRSEYFTSFIGTLGEILQKGLVDVGFLGGLQIDRYGNINSTLVRTDGKMRHFTGSGGASDIATFSRNVYVIIKHERRKIVDTLDYLTTAGYLRGHETRRECGLPMCESIKVITNLCVMGINPEDKSLQVESIHPGISEEDIINSTGFEVKMSPGTKVTEQPTEEELRLLRERIDPAGMYIK